MLDLPRPHDEETLKATQSWGFVWPEDHVYNRHMSRRQPLTVPVQVPAGWSVKSTDHWLYMNLIDPAGQVRGSLMIHYQDHDSWLSLTQKYRASFWQKTYGDDEPLWPVIEDSNRNVVWVGTRVDAEPGHHERMRTFWQDRHAGRNPGEEEPRSPMDKALDASRSQLSAWGIDPADPKWFEKGFDFPALDDTRPVVQAYSIHTEYYHNPGDHYACDQGSSELLASDDKDALERLEKIKRNRGGYHRKWALYNPEGKEIARGEDPRPRPRPNSRDSWGRHVFNSYYKDGNCDTDAL